MRAWVFKCSFLGNYLLLLVHELEPKKLGIWLRQVDKTQYRFLVISGCLLSRKVWWAVQIGSLFPKIEVFYRPEWTKGVTTLKWILSIFKFRNICWRQGLKSRWKNGVICLVPMFPPFILQFCADLSKKSKSVKAIYIYASKRSRYALSENGNCLLCYELLLRRYYSVNSKILWNFYWVSIFFDILIPSISWMVAQTPINYIIFWKSVMRTFRCNM